GRLAGVLAGAPAAAGSQNDARAGERDRRSTVPIPRQGGRIVPPENPRLHQFHRPNNVSRLRVLTGGALVFGSLRGGVLVRAVADRAFLPTKNLLEQVGDMMILTGKTVMSAIRPPYPYGTEFVQQFLFALRLCWFPLLISTIAFGYGAPGLQAG